MKHGHPQPLFLVVVFASLATPSEHGAAAVALRRKWPPWSFGVPATDALLYSVATGELSG
ncbi:hypothetical protein [Methylovulum psychrotolerans]|uniref:hypothetical protein n=1 Tax=Methylovulum psychrotolerans TaxID=1704499 RepID=UPI000CDE7034|nr:hypothetical protein [Methylovulum psychrotolerans]